MDGKRRDGKAQEDIGPSEAILHPLSPVSVSDGWLFSASSHVPHDGAHYLRISFIQHFLSMCHMLGAVIGTRHKDKNVTRSLF